MAGPLDLSTANRGAFDAIPSGKYDAKVFKVEPVTFDKEDGKLPKGTEGYNVQFAIDGGQYDNRRVFNRYWLPSDEYDKDKRANMLGMFVDFLLAIGYSEKEVTSGKFKFDAEDAEGRECSLSVGQREWDGDTQNTVRRVKPRSQDLEDAGIL